jgi:uncharacterized protein (DUF952 family)
VRPTFHLVARDWWDATDSTAALGAPSLADEGFIHCTDGAANMVETANRHYRDDPREFLVLTIDLDEVTSTWRTDDPGGIYPHVFGPIDRSAIVAAVDAPREQDGTFLPFAV